MRVWGFSQFAQIGQPVQAGEPLAVVHAADKAAADHARAALLTLIEISDEPISLAPVMVQRVDARIGADIV
jgi:thymidine phosphorylase